MYFSVAVNGSRHLWRERFPRGEPEQITFGPTGEDGLAIAPDGQSLVTSVGQGRSVLWIHDSAGERALSAEGYVSRPEFGKSGRRVYYLERRSALSGETDLRALDLATGNAERLLPGISVKDFDVSTDEREVAYTIDSDGESQIWLASLDRRSAPRKVTTSGDLVSFGAADELVFRALDKTKSYLARVKKDGIGRAHVTDTPIIDKGGVSSDGTWAVAIVGRSDEGAASGTVAFPLNGGAARTICDAYCALRWDGSGAFLYVTRVGGGPARTFALSLTGRTLAEVFSTAVDTSALAAPDARVLEHEFVAPGPDPATYVFVRADDQQNLFRIPLHATALRP